MNNSCNFSGKTITHATNPHSPAAWHTTPPTMKGRTFGVLMLHVIHRCYCFLCKRHSPLDCFQIIIGEITEIKASHLYHFESKYRKPLTCRCNFNFRQQFVIWNWMRCFVNSSIAEKASFVAKLPLLFGVMYQKLATFVLYKLDNLFLRLRLLIP